GWSAQNAAYRLARVRPKPAFVVRVVLASVIAACALVLAAAGALGALSLPIGATNGRHGVIGRGLLNKGVADDPRDPRGPDAEEQDGDADRQ
ncbi:hypothetical protein ACC691_38550, partial [Rhizobium johnstonii]|uniref:hypothetical protein n=1 Tax=Rhizobium johnstonii TaxID=3019933 RepID=UPI003F95F32C